MAGRAHASGIISAHLSAVCSFWLAVGPGLYGLNPYPLIDMILPNDNTTCRSYEGLVMHLPLLSDPDELIDERDRNKQTHAPLS
jgi:hypothetical protein